MASNKMPNAVNFPEEPNAQTQKQKQKTPTKKQTERNAR